MGVFINLLVSLHADSNHLSNMLHFGYHLSMSHEMYWTKMSDIR